MSLVLPPFSTNIELSPCLKSSPRKNMWARTNKKNQKNVRWSDSLEEVFLIPCQENETEIITKTPSEQDAAMLESLLGDLLYSNMCVKNINCLGDSVTDRNSSSSETLQRFDRKDTGVSDSISSDGDNGFFLEEREADLSKKDYFTFNTLKPLKPTSREDTTNSETVLQKEQAAINNLEHLLASLSVFSGEGKRYLNVMF